MSARVNLQPFTVISLSCCVHCAGVWQHCAVSSRDTDIAGSIADPDGSDYRVQLPADKFAW